MDLASERFHECLCEVLDSGIFKDRLPSLARISIRQLLISSLMARIAHRTHRRSWKCRIARIVAPVIIAGGALALWPVASAQSSSTSTTSLSNPTFRLQAFDFETPSDGLGVFSTRSAGKCRDYVGHSTDGGVTFASLVRIVRSSCTTFYFAPSLVSDGRGDAFLYGPRLYVSHDNAKTWTQNHQFGSVLDVDAVGRSVWLIESECTPGESVRSVPCSVRMFASMNGGRSWTASKVFAGGVNGMSSGANGQSYLDRFSRTSAYLMLAPSVKSGRPSVAPLWYTSDGGATWSKRDVPCHIGAFSSVLSVDASGTLMAACASEASAGQQIKSILLSPDGGLNWTLKTDSNIDYGYLGQIDLLNSEDAFLVGGRSSLLETHDGGVHWRAVQPLIGSSAGGTAQVTFFGGVHGLVLGNDDSDNENMTLWSTANAGRNWSVEIPQVK
jgi:photosystem II stability/assembly factor-like uncharacterized protein